MVPFVSISFILRSTEGYANKWPSIVNRFGIILNYIKPHTPLQIKLQIRDKVCTLFHRVDLHYFAICMGFFDYDDDLF